MGPSTVGGGYGSTDLKSPSNSIDASFLRWQPPTLSRADTERIVGPTKIDPNTVTCESREEWLAADAADAKFLRAKHAFIDYQLTRLVEFAEQNYMILAQRKWYKSQRSKISNSDTNGQQLIGNYDRLIGSNKERLLKRLGDFDNAREAVQWLIKHFNLLLTRRQIGREVFDLSSRIVALRSSGRTEDAVRSEIDQLCSRLGDSRNALADVLKQAAELRRETLTLGVRFMDLNMSGAVEPEDRPQISTELFSRLDVGRKHRFTAADVQSSVTTMEKNIVKIDNRILDLQKEMNKLYHEQNNIRETNAEKLRLKQDKIQTELEKCRAEINQLNLERNREDMYLRETFAFFQECFTQALFTNLGYGRHKISEGFQGAIRADVAGVQRDLTLPHVSEASGAKQLGVEAPSSFSKGGSTFGGTTGSTGTGFGSGATGGTGFGGSSVGQTYGTTGMEKASLQDPNITTYGKSQTMHSGDSRVDTGFGTGTR